MNSILLSVRCNPIRHLACGMQEARHGCGGAATVLGGGVQGSGTIHGSVRPQEKRVWVTGRKVFVPSSRKSARPDFLPTIVQ